MKKTIYALAILLFISFAFSCQQKSNLSFEKTVFTVTNGAQNFDISFNRIDIHPDFLEAAHTLGEQNLLDFVNSEYSAINNMVYNELLNYQLSEGAGRWYLIFQGYSLAAKSMSSFAYEIKMNSIKTKAELVMHKSSVNAGGRVTDIIASESHTCTGQPCSCCSFLRDSSDNITGCKCDQVLNVSAPCYGGSGKCNHTVTTGGTVGAYGQCGGIGWTGPTACASPYTCTRINDYYYQCLP